MIVNPKEAFESYREPVFTGIPDELKGYRQWVVWKLETTQDNQEKGKKPTKIPYSPLTHRKSGVNDSYQATWGTFEEACIAFSTGKYSGIMLNITDSDPFVVIDFDHCVAGGEINEEIKMKFGPLGANLDMPSMKKNSQLTPQYKAGGGYSNEDIRKMDDYLPDSEWEKIKKSQGLDSSDNKYTYLSEHRGWDYGYD